MKALSFLCWDIHCVLLLLMTLLHKLYLLETLFWMAESKFSTDNHEDACIGYSVGEIFFKTKFSSKKFLLLKF